MELEYFLDESIEERPRLLAKLAPADAPLSYEKAWVFENGSWRPYKGIWSIFIDEDVRFATDEEVLAITSGVKPE